MTLNVFAIAFPADEANILQNYLNEPGESEINCKICNLDEGMEALRNQHPELVFLNIDALRERASAVTQRLLEISHSLRVVFVADDTGHSADAYELAVYDYIVKPVSRERLFKTLMRISKELRNDSCAVLPVWKNDRFVVLKPEQIVYCYTEGNKTLIKSKTGEYSCLNSLYSFEQKLSHPAFFRTHKSFLVNLDYIKEIIPWFNHTYHLVMNLYEKDEIPVSRTHLKDFKKRMGIE